MSQLSWLQKFYWERLAAPSTDRALFRQLISTPISSFLEIGLGSGRRMQIVARLACPSENKPVRYIGVDGFESSSDGRPHISLKQAHQQAIQLGLRAVFIPGDLPSALPRAAHKVGACDLVVVDGGLDPLAIDSGIVAQWLRHLCHANSCVLACRQPGERLMRIEQKSQTRQAA